MPVSAPSSRRGARPDADDTSRRPVLVIGRDSIPSACDRCGSLFLTREIPVGRALYGTLTCGICSRLVAWLAGPIAAVRPRAQPAAPAPDERPVRAVEVVTFGRLTSCGEACSVVSGHDALTHEQHGYTVRVDEERARLVGAVAVGPVVVDFDARRVFVDAVEAALSPTEYELLSMLAASPGRVVLHREIVAAIWGATAGDLWAGPSARSSFLHAIRVIAARLRRRLDRAAEYIVTVAGVGYMLPAEPLLDEGSTTEP
jgi:DNA-binding winged helix-turn-helix (wHTH) protein